MKQSYLVTLGAMALAMVIGSGTARADSLYLGQGYNIIYTTAGRVGGGIFGQTTSSTLNGTVLPWIYCVDFYDRVNVPDSYPNATVTGDGTIAGSDANDVKGGLVGYSGTDGTMASIKNVQGVAWLLHNFATSAVGNRNAQIGLQGAIWTTIYGSGLTLTDPPPQPGDPGNSAAAVTAYKNNLTALTNAQLAGPLHDYVGNYKWISPGGKDQTPVRQGLVTVPDGGVTLMLLGGALVGLETLRRKFRA